MEKNYGIQKWYEKNNAILEFTFNGYLEENDLPIEKIEILLDKCFERMPFYQNINLIMSWIQTILKDFKDDYLQLSLLDKNGKETKVEYKNKRLIYFETNEEIEKGKTLNTIYTQPFNFHTCVINKGLNKEELLEMYKEKIKDALQQISDLEDISSINLTEKDKLICEIYQLFYGENPDFTDKDISIKMQTMFCILIQFNVSLDYGFDQVILDNKMPLSLQLQYDIDRLTPLGEINKIKEPVKIAEHQKRKIEVVGEIVRKSTKNNLDNLIQLSTIIYGGRYDLSQEHDIEKVAKYAGYSNEKVEESINLVRRIENQLEQIKH